MIKIYEKCGKREILKSQWWNVFDTVRNIHYINSNYGEEYGGSFEEFITSWWKRPKDNREQIITISDQNEKLEIYCYWKSNLELDKIAVMSSSEEFADMILIREIMNHD